MNRAFACLVLTSAAVVMLGGCSGSTASGTVYAVSLTRHVKAYLPYDHETIYNTALETLETTFMYTIEKNELDGRTGYLKARTARENMVTFSVTRDSDAMSEVSVFVGPVGDEDAARDILSRVEKALRSR